MFGYNITTFLDESFFVKIYASYQIKHSTISLDK